MNALEPMQTVFHFIFKEAGGGGGGGGEDIEIVPAVAQTGDWLSILIAVLFAAIALCLIGYFIYKRKAESKVTGSHVVAKSAISAKMIAIGIAIVLAIAGCAFSLANGPLLRAFANGTANADMDYGTDINVYVYEETQTIEFETGNYFTNLTDTPIHIDSSKLTLSEEAKALGIPDFEFKATYENNQTDVFAGEPDQVAPDVPTEQTALATNATQKIKYSTNMTYETAKLLSTLENAFTLELTETPCYTIQYDANSATSGEVPASETLSLSTEEGALNINAVAPENTGNLEKSSGENNAFRFIGWNTKNDGTGTYYKPGETIPGSESAKVGDTVPLYVEWELGYIVQFQSDQYINIEEVNGNTNSSFSKFIPKTHETGASANTTYAVSTEPSTLNYLTFTWKDRDQKDQTYTVRPVQTKVGHNFEKWQKDGQDFPAIKVLTANSTFTALSYESSVTITYKVVNEDYPHGSLSLNSANDEEDNSNGPLVGVITETFKPQDGESPVGAKVVADTSYFQYEFINWTKVGSDVTYDTESFVPNLTKEGIDFFVDATYVVHLAAPKAIVQKEGSDKTIMRFVYDDEEYPEISSMQKYPVNNAVLDTEDASKSVVPSWYTNPSFNSWGNLEINPSPKVNPNKAIIDPSFKDYKGLTSTSMWFMDSFALQIFISMGKNHTNGLLDYSLDHKAYSIMQGPLAAPLKSQRNLESVEGLENICTDNLASTDLMFTNGINAGMAAEGGSAGSDLLKNIDLSSWVSSAPFKDTSAIGMFAGCSGLTNIVFPQTTDAKSYAFGDSSLNMSAIFMACTSLKTINFNKNFGSKAKIMDYAFSFNSGITELDFDKTDTKGLLFGSSATSMAYFAAKCTNLRILNIKNFTGENIKTTKEATYVFGFDSSLVKFVLSDDWKIPYQYMDDMPISMNWFKYTPDTTPPYTEYSVMEIPSKSKGGTFTRDSAKAVYAPGAAGGNASFTFYYDHEIHEGTEYAIPLASSGGGKNEKPIIVKSSKQIFPDWYKATATLNGNEVELTELFGSKIESLFGKDIDIKIELLLPDTDTNCNVVFDETFQNCENLREMHYWFVADSYGKAPFVSYSGFENIPTGDLEEASEMFGGCSTEAMLCRVVPNLGYQISVLADTNFLSNCDTYNTRLTSLDLSGFNFPYWHGLVQNCPNLTTITIPQSLEVENLAYAFFNDKSLTTINNLNNIETNQCHQFTKMFAGCSSIGKLDLSHFNTLGISNYYNGNMQQQMLAVYGMFKDCHSLTEFTIPSDNGKQDQPSWGIFMRYASLPDDYGTTAEPTDDNPWIAEEFDDREVFSKDIPWKDEHVDPDLADENHVYGKFTRNAPESKREITLSKIPAEGGGTISPADNKIEVYGDVKIAVSGTTLIVNDKEYVPTPAANYIFDAWTINGQRIQPSHFYTQIINIPFNDSVWQTGVEIKAVFVNENLKARAVYEEGKVIDGKTVNTLTYYYDENLHEEGQVFEVINNTGLDMSDPHNVSLTTPSWIDSTFEFDQSKIMSGTGIKVNTEWKISPNAIVFDSSFKQYENLESISMWWMADHNNYQPVEKFYSPAAGSVASSANEGFSNLFTGNIRNMQYAFGGFWIDLDLGPMTSVYADALQTYGRGIQTLDVSTLDMNKLSDMSMIFANCTALQQVTLGENFDSSSVTNMTGMFYNCENLGKNDETNGIVNFNKISTSKAQDLSYMFFGCCNMKELDLSNFDLSAATRQSADDHTPSTTAMFYDCTRLQKLTFNTIFDSSVPTGWTAIFGNNDQEGTPQSLTEGLCGLKENYNSDGKAQLWHNVNKPGTELSSKQLPWDFDQFGYFKQPDAVYSGTFVREAPTENNVVFNAGEHGLVNGKNQEIYNYIQSAKITVDEEDETVIWADNYKITATPESEDYKFMYWTFGDEWGELAGRRVTQDLLNLFDSTMPPQASGYTFKAVFVEANLTAKAIYTSPATAETTGHMKFVYDDQEYPDTDTQKVFEINGNFNEYSYPTWYTPAPNYVFDPKDDHVVPIIDSFIEASGAKNITVEIDSSFKKFDGLLSLSCWFMPAIKSNAQDWVYFGEPDSEFNYPELPNITFKIDGANNINTTNVSNVKYMFGGIETFNDLNGAPVSTLDISGFDDEFNLPNAEALFANCPLLTTITWTHTGGQTTYGSNIKNFKKLFYNCRSLTDEKLKNAIALFDFGNATDISYMLARYYFDPASKTSPSDEIVYDFGNISFKDSINSILAEGIFAGVCDTKKITIKDDNASAGTNALPSIASYKAAFKDCLNLESVDFTDTKRMSTAGTKDMSYMFSGCSNLSDLSFIKSDGQRNLLISSQTTNLSYMFENCTKLSKFYTPGSFDFSGVISMEGMFANTGLTSFDFAHAFFASPYTEKLRNISYMFYNCSNLKEVSLNRDPDQQLPSGRFDLRYVCANCPNLEKVDLTGLNVSMYQIIAEQSLGCVGMFAFVDSNGKETPNSTISNFVIDETWPYRMHDTGLTVYEGQTDILYRSLVSDADLPADYSEDKLITWFNKDNSVIAPIKISNIGQGQAGSFTHDEPHTLSLSANNSQWGKVYVGNKVATSFNYYDSLEFYLDEATGNVIINYKGTDNIIKSKKAANSTFNKWTYIDDAGEEHDITATHVTFTGNDNNAIIANFEDGDLLVAKYTSFDESNASGTLTIGLDKYHEEDNIWPINPDGYSEESLPEWHSKASSITKVVFNSSIQNVMFIKSTAYWFMDCSNLTDIDMSYLKFNNVTNFDSMFKNCGLLTKVDFPRGAYLTNISTNDMFNNCSSLKSFSLGDMSTFRSYTNMFAGCNSVQYLHFMSSSINLVEAGFPNDSNVKWLRYRYYRGQYVYTTDEIEGSGRGDLYIRISGTFKFTTDNPEICQFEIDRRTWVDTIVLGINPELGLNCSYSVTEYNSVRWAYNFSPAENYSIDGGMYSDWSSDSGARIMDQFENTKMVTGIKLNDTPVEAGANGLVEADDNFQTTSGDKLFAKASFDNGTLTFFCDTNPVESGQYNVNGEDWYSEWYLPQWVNEHKTDLTKVVFESSFKDYKGISWLRFWFYNCSELTSVEGCGNLNCDNLRELNNMFYGCSKLTSIDFSGVSMPAAYNYENMFNGCSLLESANLGDAYAAETNEVNTNMFDGCSSLISVTFGENWKTPVKITNDDEKYFINQETGASFKNGKFPYIGNSGHGEFKLGENHATISVNDAHYGEIYGADAVYFDDEFDAYYQVRNNEFSVPILYIQMRPTQSNNDTFEYEIIGKAYNGFKLENWTYNGDPITVGDDYEEISGDVKSFSANFVRSDNSGAKIVYHKTNQTINFVYDDNNYDGDTYEVTSVLGTTDETHSTFSENMLSGAKSITFEPSFKQYLDAKSWRYFFKDFNQLESISGFENICSDNLGDVSYMFYQLPSTFTSLDLDGFTLNGKNVSLPLYANEFIYQNQGLQTVTFDGSDFSKLNYAIGFCSENPELTDVDVKALNVSNVKNASYMFNNNTKLENFVFKDADGNSEFMFEKCTNYSYMFSSCRALTTLDMSFVSLYDKEWGEEFNMIGFCTDCLGLKEIDASAIRGNAYQRYAGCGEWDSGWAGGCVNVYKLTFGSNITDKISRVLWIIAGKNWVDSENNVINTDNKVGAGTYYKIAVLSFNVSDVDAGKLSNEDSVNVFEYSRGEKATYTVDGRTITINVESEAGTPVGTYTYTTEDKDPDAFSFQGWMMNDTPISDTGEISGSASFKAYYSEELVAKAVYYEATANEPSKLVFYYNDVNYDPRPWYRVAKEINAEWGEQQEWTRDERARSAYTIEIDNSFAQFPYLRNLEGFFRGMQFKEIKGLGNINCSNVESTQYMFAECNQVEVLNVSDLNTEYVKRMNRMFSEMSNVVKILFTKQDGSTNFITNNVRWMEFMFFNDYKLVQLDMSSFEFDQPILSLNEFCWNCYELEEVDISGFYASQNIVGEERTETNGWYMFENCNSLRSLTIGSLFNITMYQVFCGNGASPSGYWINENGKSYYKEDWETWDEGTYTPVAALQSGNNSDINQPSSTVEPQADPVDPVDPQVDPEVDPTKETEGDDNSVPFTLAALAMGPALAALGFRKRIRGKHAKL